MPSIYQLKPAFQNLLRPVVERLYARGVTANQVTLSAAMVSVRVPQPWADARSSPRAARVAASAFRRDPALRFGRLTLP